MRHFYCGWKKNKEFPSWNATLERSISVSTGSISIPVIKHSEKPGFKSLFSHLGYMTHIRSLRLVLDSVSNL